MWYPWSAAVLAMVAATTPARSEVDPTDLGAGDPFAPAVDAGPRDAGPPAAPEPDTPASPPSRGPAPEEVAAFFDAFFAEQIPALRIGGAVVVFVRDGQVIFTKGYGRAEPGGAEPPDPARSVFRVASISKVFTATALMQLVEQGLVDLDADANRALRSMQIAPAHGAPVRVRDLLTHTAGFDDRVSGIAARTAAELSLRTFASTFQPRRGLPPGTMMSYSNYGYCVLGLLIEDVTGQPFDAYLRDHVLAPLGMHDSSFAMPEALADRLVPGLLPMGGSLVPVPRFHIHMMPASTLITTARDMARFLIAHLEGGAIEGRRILSEQTVRRMHGQLFTQHPALSGNAHGFWEYHQNGRRVLQHGGSWFGYESLLALMPEERTGWFMVHTGGDGRSRVRLIERLLDRFYPDPAPPPSIAPVATDVERLAGVYVWNRLARSTFEKIVSLLDGWIVHAVANDDGTLTLHYPKDVVGPHRFVPVGDGVLRREDGDGSIVFRTGPDGAATHLFAYVVDLPIVAERVPSLLCPEVVVPAGFTSLGLVMSGVAVMPIVWRRRRRSHRGLSPVRRHGSEWAGLLTAAAYTVFVAGVVVVLGPPRFMEPVYGIPEGIDLVRAVPLLALPTTAALASLVVRDWLRVRGDLATRAYLSVQAAAAVIAALFLAHINWLGWWS